MSNKFEIQIVALDRASKVFQRVNDSASRTLRPVTQTARQLAVLGRAAHVPALGRGLSTAARSAGQLATNLGLATGPMTALVGPGAAGSLTALVGSVALLTSRWASLGFAVDNTARTFGLPARELQRVQGAAKQAGVPVEATTEALTDLAQRLRLVNIGDPAGAGLLQVLRHLQIPLSRTKEGAIDTMGALEGLSRAISREKNPLTQLAIANEAGVAAMLPLLRKGPEAIRALGDEAERLGVVKGPKALQWAVQFSNSLAGLSGALEGVSNKAGALLAPGLTSGMDRLTAKITGQEPWIKLVPSPADLAAREASRRYVWNGGALFGPQTPAGPGRKVSGMVTDESGNPTGPINLGTPAGQAQVLEDVVRSNGTQYSSDAVRQRMEATVNVIVNAPPGAPVRVHSDSPNVRARISHAMPSGSLP